MESEIKELKTKAEQPKKQDLRGVHAPFPAKPVVGPAFTPGLGVGRVCSSIHRAMSAAFTRLLSPPVAGAR